jgi:hypothetical protein
MIAAAARSAGSGLHPRMADKPGGHSLADSRRNPILNGNGMDRAQVNTRVWLPDLQEQLSIPSWSVLTPPISRRRRLAEHRKSR